MLRSKRLDFAMIVFPFWKNADATRGKMARGEGREAVKRRESPRRDNIGLKRFNMFSARGVNNCTETEVAQNARQENGLALVALDEMHGRRATRSFQQG